MLSTSEGRAFWKVSGDDLLTLAQQLETFTKAVYGVNVHLAGEIDSQTLAKQRSCPSTAALLRQALLISPAEAFSRVNAARAILPQEALTGVEIDPVLPALATALNTGTLGSEHVKTIVATLKKLPTQMPEADRSWWERFLVEHAAKLNPRTCRTSRKLCWMRRTPTGRWTKKMSDPGWNCTSVSATSKPASRASPDSSTITGWR